MEYQKIVNFLDSGAHQINHLNLEQKIGLKQMMNQEEHALVIDKLILKRQW